jgi:hypothetical protein
MIHEQLTFTSAGVACDAWHFRGGDALAGPSWESLRLISEQVVPAVRQEP